MKSSKRQTANRSAEPVAVPPAGSISWLLIGALFVLAFLFYEIHRPALNGPFLFDDVYLPFLVPNFARQPLLDWLVGVRPTLQFTYWLNYRVTGLHAWSFHLVSLLLHAASGYFVWLIARKLLETFVTIPARRTVFAAFAAAVFLLHPVQSESVAYVASRSEVLSGFFFLLAWTLFLYRRNSAIRFGEVALVLVVFLLALSSKEHTAVLPAVLLLTDYFFNPGFSLEGIRRNWRLYAPLLAGAFLGGFIIFKVVLGRSTSAGFGLQDLTPLDYLFTQFRSIVTYLRLYFLPVGLNVDYDVPISHSLWDHYSWLNLLILLALTVCAWVYRKRFPLAAFGFFLFLVLLAPTSSIVPIRDVLVERRMYLPVFGVTLCVVDFLRRRNIELTPLAAGLAAVCAVLGILSWQRSHVWSSPLSLWQDAVAGSPQKYRPRFQLAYAHYQAGECLESTQRYAEAAKLAPKPAYELYIDWALAADCAGKTGEALSRLDEAIKLEPSAHAWSLLGMVRAKQGDYDRALNALSEAEKVDPRYPMIFLYRGNIHAARNEWDAAVAEYQKAAAIDPSTDIGQQAAAHASAARRRAAEARQQPPAR